MPWISLGTYPAQSVHLIRGPPEPSLALIIVTIQCLSVADVFCFAPLFFRFFLSSRCPVPPILRHARNPYREYPPGLQVAPGVFLFFEPWPSEDILPMPKKFSVEAAEETADDASPAMAALEKEMAEVGKPSPPRARRGGGGGLDRGGILSAFKAVEGAAGGGVGVGEKKNKKETGENKTRNGGDSSKLQGGEIIPQYFSLTLCVGQYLFTSVVGVEAAVLEFIVNRWLHFVPVKKPHKNPLKTPAPPPPVPRPPT